MKNYYLINLLIAAMLTVTIAANATMRMVNVADFSFTPSTMTVAVGDTVEWMWVSGTHTTTSTSVPNGAATWDNNINSSNSFFMYKVTVVGTYNYHCSIHPSQMTGDFTAISTAGISTISLDPLINWTIKNNEVTLGLNLNAPTTVIITVSDMLGKKPIILNSDKNVQGAYEKTFSLNDLQKGVYLVDLIADNRRVTRRIVVE